MIVAPARKPLIVLLAGAAIIGVGTVLVRLTGTGPAAAGFWRLAFALPFMVLLSLVERRRGGLATGLGAPGGLLLLCGLAFAADLTSWHYSLKFTSVADSSILANLTPVLVTVLAWVVLRERPERAFLAGLALAVGGAVIIACAHSGARGAEPPLGDALALLASFWYAVYFMAVRQVRRTASALQVMLASSAVGAPLVLVAAIALHEPLVPATLSGWAGCVGLGVMHVTGQGAIAWSLGKVPAAVAAMVVLIQPVIAAAAGWMVFHETVGPLQALGGVLALAGVAVAQLAARKSTPPVVGEAEALAGPA